MFDIHIKINIFKIVLIHIDIDIDIFKNDHVDSDINIDIFKMNIDIDISKFPHQYFYQYQVFESSEP